MRKILAFALFLVTSAAFGQAYTTVTATDVTVDNGSGTAINPPSGTNLCFVGVNSAGTPISYTPSGGSTVTAGTQVCQTLNSGGGLTGSLQVANPATASPGGLLYTITVVNGSTTYLTLPTVTLSGTVWSYDAYVLPATLTALGIGHPHIACVYEAAFTSTTLPSGQNSFSCNQAGAWYGYPPATFCPSGQSFLVPQGGGQPFCAAPTEQGTGTPTGSCTQNSVYQQQDSNALWYCKSGSWASAGSGASTSAANVFTATNSFANITTQLPRVNVTDQKFGAPSGCSNTADPSGTNDSTCAINAAVSYAVANPQGGLMPSIYFPAGTYKISGNIPVPAFITIWGDGAATTSINQTSATSNIFTVGVYTGAPQPPNVWLGEGGIYHLRLYSSLGHNYTATMVELDNVTGYRIAYNEFNNSGGRGLVTNGSSERDTFYGNDFSTIRWPIISNGNEMRWINTNLDSPGEDGSGYCFGMNCINGAYPSDQWNVGTLEYASGNGTTATFYVHGSYHNGASGGSAPMQIGNEFTVAGTTGTVLDGTYVSTSITNGVTSDPSGLCTTGNPCFEVTAASTVSGVATVTSATWVPTIVPDQLPGSFFISGAVPVVIGGSIKAVWFAPAFQTVAIFSGDIQGFYLEGFPIYGQPHLDAGLIDGGIPQQTTATSAMSSASPWSISVASTQWFFNYVNDPANAYKVSGGLMYIEPQDYLRGSNAASAYVPGVLRGQYEVVLGSFSDDGALHIATRNVSGSTAPSNTAWPSGSIIVQDFSANYGRLKFQDNHMETIDAPGSNWGTDCSDSGQNICAEVIAGTILTNNNPVTNPYAVNIDAADNGWWGSCATSEATSGQDCIKILSNSDFSGGSYNQAGSLYNGTFGNTSNSNIIQLGYSTAQNVANGYFSDSANLNKETMIDNFNDAVLGQNPGSSTNSAFGNQFFNSRCWYDTPTTSSTHAQVRFCLVGGPNNINASAGFEFDVWDSGLSAWDTYLTYQANPGQGHYYLKTPYNGPQNTGLGIVGMNSNAATASYTFQGPQMNGEQFKLYNGTSSTAYTCGVQLTSNTANSVVPTGINFVQGCFTGSTLGTVLPLPLFVVHDAAAGSTDDYTQYTGGILLPAASTVNGVKIDPTGDFQIVVPGGTLATGTCQATATTQTVTGLTTTMMIGMNFSSDPTASAGWGGAGMIIDAWPSAANTLSYKLCNYSTSSTYGAITFNAWAH